MTDWESSFRFWAQSPAETEQLRIEHAETAVRKAVSGSVTLSSMGVQTFLHGSYRNRVNVRQDSDVDIGLLCARTFFWNGPPGYTMQDLGIVPATYDHPEFRSDVEAALRNYFPSNTVSPGNKAFDIKSNKYRVEADVTPFFEYRLYRSVSNYVTGVAFQPAGLSDFVVNWPEQHYQNGKHKNEQTSRRYRGCVRILKRLQNEVLSTGTDAIPGFLIECMCFRVPDTLFMQATYKDSISSVLAHLYHATENDGACHSWPEVSGLKELFGAGQKWTRPQANSYVLRAWNALQS